MSKAEDLAAKLIIPKHVDDIEELCRFCYIKGYHQAEKNLELTWEDLKTMVDISDDVYAKCDVEMFDEKEYYQEILNRFNKQKGK